jgi:hypothetical protein
LILAWHLPRFANPGTIEYETISVNFSMISKAHEIEVIARPAK